MTTRTVTREVTEALCACGAWFELTAGKGSPERCPACVSRDRLKAAARDRLAKHRARVRGWYARRGCKWPAWAEERPDDARVLAEASAVLERVLPKLSAAVLTAGAAGAPAVRPPWTQSEDQAFGEALQGIGALANELDDEAKGVASHCERLGHDYEVAGDGFACGRCGARL